METLGTDGFGRSDNREHLRKHFEINAESIAAAALSRLARDGKFDAGEGPGGLRRIGRGYRKDRPRAGLKPQRKPCKPGNASPAGMAVSGALAVIKIVAGVAGHSTAVVADGMESAGDVFSSGFVLLGLTLAAKPADDNHPYGHGRVEILTGLLIGLMLTAGGALISSARSSGWAGRTSPVALFVVWPLVASLVAKTALAVFKFRFGRKLESDALTADAWNDATDSLSAIAALIAVGLTLSTGCASRRPTATAGSWWG